MFRLFNQLECFFERIHGWTNASFILVVIVQKGSQATKRERGRNTIKSATARVVAVILFSVYRGRALILKFVPFGLRQESALVSSLVLPLARSAKQQSP